MAGCILFEIVQPKKIYKIRIRTEIPYGFGRKFRTDFPSESVRNFRETSVPIRTDSFYIRDILRQGFSDLGYAILYTTWLCHFIAIKWQNLYKMAPTLYNGCTHPIPMFNKGMFLGFSNVVTSDPNLFDPLASFSV